MLILLFTCFPTAYYFRNLVEIIRPELIPIEIGVLQCTYHNNWEILGCFSDDIVGPGCFKHIFIHQPHLLTELLSHQVH